MMVPRLLFAPIILLFILTSVTACTDDEPNIDDDKPTGQNDLIGTDFNILFIGNSLTYFNNLPELVEQVGEANGVEIGTKGIAYADYALIDHWNDGEIQLQIARGLYDYVVVQQGPSSQTWGREILIEYGEKIKAICDENDTKLAFYMVWPSRTYYGTFDGVIKNYSDAAQINNAILCPVGQVWKTHFDQTGDFSYYGSDGFHPSLKGSEVAAEVIYTSIIR